MENRRQRGGRSDALEKDYKGPPIKEYRHPLEEG